MIGTTSFVISEYQREIHTPYANAPGMLLHINGKYTIVKLKSSLFCRKVYFLTVSHCQFRGAILYFRRNGIDAINKVVNYLVG